MPLEAACTVLCAWHVAAFELHLCGCAIEDHVLYNATAVNLAYTIMCLPAAVVLRHVLWVKAYPGRTDAKVQICLQTHTLCRLETGMDDCVAAVTAAVAAGRRCKQRIQNIKQLAFFLGIAPREKFNRVPRTHL